MIFLAAIYDIKPKFSVKIIIQCYFVVVVVLITRIVLVFKCITFSLFMYFDILKRFVTYGAYFDTLIACLLSLRVFSCHYLGSVVQSKIWRTLVKHYLILTLLGYKIYKHTRTFVNIRIAALKEVVVC